jgi:hypothetical protein
MQAQRGCGGIATTHLQPGPRKEVGGQYHAPATLPQEACYASGPVWMSWKISSPPGFNPQTVQPVASLYRLHYPSRHI